MLACERLSEREREREAEGKQGIEKEKYGKERKRVGEIKGECKEKGKKNKESPYIRC